MANPDENPNDAIFSSLEAYALSVGKSALLLSRPGKPGHMLYVSDRELDPLSACMSAFIDIMIQRGKKTGMGPVRIRKVTDIVAPGCNYYWSIHGKYGKEVSGYARDEAEAKQKISDYLLANSQING